MEKFKKVLSVIWKLVSFNGGIVAGVVVGILFMLYLFICASTIHRLYNETVTEKNIDIQIKEEQLKNLKLRNAIKELEGE